MTVLVPHEPISAALVRHELAADLGHYSLPDSCVDDAVLVISELTSNALRHSTVADDGASIDASWDVAVDGITIRVSDTGANLPDPQSADDRLAAGRGLTVVAALTDRWGVEPWPVGKCVWAHVPV
ncbi:MAG: ATP-binding protein [Trebonia sp.]